MIDEDEFTEYQGSKPSKSKYDVFNEIVGQRNQDEFADYIAPQKQGASKAEQFGKNLQAQNEVVFITPVAALPSLHLHNANYHFQQKPGNIS